MAGIGTCPQKRCAALCPQPKEADIRPLDGNSRFDPKETLRVANYCIARAITQSSTRASDVGGTSKDLRADINGESYCSAVRARLRLRPKLGFAERSGNPRHP